MAAPHLVALLLLCCMAGVGRAQPATFAQRYPNNVDTTDCPEQFSCLTTPAECVDITVVGDCTDDCSNGADELCGVGEDRCNVDALPGVTDGVGAPIKACGNCFDPRTTDQTILCLDRRYEATCGIDLLAFDCTNTVNCVPRSFVLDGENDCFDKSDENPCMPGRETLPLYPCDAAATCGWDPTAATQTGDTTCTCPAGSAGDGRKAALGGTGCAGTSTTTSSTTTTPTASTSTSTSTATESTTSTPTTSSTSTSTSTSTTGTSGSDKTRPCFAARKAAIKERLELGINARPYVPSCRADGTWAALQRIDSLVARLRSTWCVERRTGDEIEGTGRRYNKGRRVPCAVAQRKAGKKGKNGGKKGGGKKSGGKKPDKKKKNLDLRFGIPG